MLSYSKANSKFLLEFYFELELMNFEIFQYRFLIILGLPSTEILEIQSILYYIKNKKRNFQVASKYYRQRWIYQLFANRRWRWRKWRRKWGMKMNYKIIIISILIDSSDQNLLHIPFCLIIILIRKIINILNKNIYQILNYD